jgi:aromatic ring-cleaving dioxygenase
VIVELIDRTSVRLHACHDAPVGLVDQYMYPLESSPEQMNWSSVIEYDSDRTPVAVAGNAGSVVCVHVAPQSFE